MSQVLSFLHSIPPGILATVGFIIATVATFIRMAQRQGSARPMGSLPAQAALFLLSAFLSGGVAAVESIEQRRQSTDDLGALAVYPDGGSQGSTPHGSPFEVINFADGGLPFQVDANAAAVTGDFVVTGTFRTGGASSTTISSIVRGRTSLQVSLNTQTCSDTQKTVTGAALGGQCLATWPGLIAPGALTIECYISAADTVQLHVCNPSAGTLATPDGGATGYGMLIFN